MALPNEIQVGRYNRFVQKLLSIKGRATTFLASPELDFVLPLFHGAENRYLEGWDLFSLVAAPAAPGVGNFETFTFRNAVGSNVMAVFTLIRGMETATAAPESVTLFRPGTAGAGAGDENVLLAAQAWDGRGRTSSTIICSRNSAAQVVRTGGLVVGTRFTVSNVDNEQIPWGAEVPLTPGEVLTFSCGTTNAGFNVTVWWRERFLEDSERA